MICLNLPPVSFRYKDLNGKKAVFDILRKKYIILTPEEWVRQHFIHFLINHCRYPKALIKIESGLRYNSLNGRSDIIVFDRSGQVFMLIECKSSELSLSDKVFEQASRYNIHYKARYLVITNGLQHFCCRIIHETGSYEFVEQLPAFE